MAEFNDKVIIVTGASEGIGRALCLALAPQKPKLVIAARNQERLNELKDELKGQGVESLVVPTDITEKEQCRELIEKTVERFGRLDVLVNNAGMGQWTLLEQIKDPSFYETIMKTNFLGGAYCTYYALPHLKKTKGRLVAVASGLGLPGTDRPCALVRKMGLRLFPEQGEIQEFRRVDRGGRRISEAWHPPGHHRPGLDVLGQTGVESARIRPERAVQRPGGPDS